MLIITSINSSLSVGWVVDRMPGLSVVYVSIGQLVEDSADMPGVVQGAGHLPARVHTVVLRDWKVVIMGLSGTLCALESFAKGSPDATGEKLGL